MAFTPASLSEPLTPAQDRVKCLLDRDVGCAPVRQLNAYLSHEVPLAGVSGDVEDDDLFLGDGLSAPGHPEARQQFFEDFAL